MTHELVLVRSPEDRRLYEMRGVGTLRLQGWPARSASVTDSSGRTWELARRRAWRAAVEATDAAGRVAGTFRSDARGRGGALRWGEEALAIRPASRWRQRYALVGGGGELARFEAKSWGRQPVRVTLDRWIEPGLLLFATYVVRVLAADAANTAAVAGAAGGAA